MKKMAQDIGIDLGTANIVMAVNGQRGSIK